jgi:hypothetical protein
MAMRPQIYQAATTATNQTINMLQVGLGQPQKTKATEFIVITGVGTTPTEDLDAYMNIKINSTEYFINPDGSQSFGVPGRASPFPKSNLFYESFFLDPEVYVLPGQNWEIRWRFGAVAGTKDGYVKYILYDGSDAVIANKLLSMGIAVKPENVDWYKRKVLEKEGAV